MAEVDWVGDPDHLSQKHEDIIMRFLAVYTGNISKSTIAESLKAAFSWLAKSARESTSSKVHGVLSYLRKKAQHEDRRKTPSASKKDAGSLACDRPVWNRPVWDRPSSARKGS